MTRYGTVTIGPREVLFAHLVRHLEALAEESRGSVSVGLTGGSTPKAFYAWALETGAVPETILDKVVWSVSDERVVPLENPESNFGNAQRLLLDPLGVPQDQRFAWPVQFDPHSAAIAYEMKWKERFGAGKAFTLCILGMGDDGHTASLFPESPLLAIDTGSFFAPVEVPEKGWRLTITPLGLDACRKILVMVTGRDKAERLKAVFEEPPGRFPVQILANMAGKVRWLVDEEAASLLS